MSKLQVPQATLYRMRSVVDAVHHGATNVEQIAVTIAASVRHALYGIASANALDLLRGRRRALTLTPLGHELAVTERGSPQEATVLRRAILASSVLNDLAPGLLSDTPPTKEAIVARICALTSLATGTAGHRAAMLLQWREQLAAKGGLRPTRRPAGRRWRRVVLEGYRSFASLTLDLAPLTVLIGANGTGKSNLVDALSFVGEASADAAAAIASRGGIGRLRCWHPTGAVDVVVELRAAASRPGLDTDYVRHRLRLCSGVDAGWRFDDELIEVVTKGQRQAGIARRGSVVESSGGELPESIEATVSVATRAAQQRALRRHRVFHNVRRLKLDPDAMRRPQRDSNECRLSETGSNVAAAIRALGSSPQVERLRAVMIQLVPGFQDLQVTSVDGTLSLKFRQPQGGAVAELHATELSEGALRALAIAVAAIQLDRDELLIVEYPETALHPSAIPILFDLLECAAERGTVLLTTHSTEWIAAAAQHAVCRCELHDGRSQIVPVERASTATPEVDESPRD